MISRKFLITTAALAIAILAPLQVALGGNTAVSISVKLDSARMMMGKTVQMHVNITQDKGLNGVLLNIDKKAITPEVEIANPGKNDTTSLDNNRIQIKRDITLQAFDPGTYQLPPMAYLVGKDTAKSEPLTLTVDSIVVDTVGPIKDFKPIIKVPSKFLDFVPDVVSKYWWAWLLGIALIAFAIFAYLKWFKKGINPLRPVKKRMPPYEEAMLNLEKLKSRNLWQNGHEKEYYTQLTDILRVYIDRRFGINAIEMTSSQIMDKLKENNDAHLANEQLNDVLEIADFVKFANMHTVADDNEISFQRAVNFVEQTRPVTIDSDDSNTEQDSTGKEAQQ